MRRALASSSSGKAGTPCSLRCLLSIRCMKKLPPTNVCCETFGRGSPSTGVTGTWPLTSGMWHDWQLRVVR